MDLSNMSIAAEVVDRISKSTGFLVTHNNAMTIGWCTSGFMWKKPVFMVPVRLSRHTHSILEQNGEFVVCVPFAGQMEDELEFTGKKSGRDINKLKDLEFNMTASDSVGIQRIDGCEYYIECRVAFQTTMDLALLGDGLQSAWYASGDPHTLYFGEILSAKKVPNRL